MMNNATPNTITQTRICSRCNKKAAVVWYTKRGRMNVMCLTCGKTWDCHYKHKLCDKCGVCEHCSGTCACPERFGR